MQKPLTPSHILQKAKTNNYSEIKSINLWGCDLDDISLISKLMNLEVALLANNRLNTLVDIAKCRNLKELNLRRNNISNKEELLLLQQLPNLTILSLRDNPIDSIPHYRETIVNHCQQLQMLDEKPITIEERRQAQNLFQVIIVDPKPELEFDSMNSPIPSFISDDVEISQRGEPDFRGKGMQSKVQKVIYERIDEEKSTKQQGKSKSKLKNQRKESEKTNKIILANAEEKILMGVGKSLHIENFHINKNNDYLLCSVICLTKMFNAEQLMIYKSYIDGLVNKLKEDAK